MNQEDLVEAYSRRDLKPQELEDLARRLEQDPEASARLLARAEQAWREAGLPEPEPPKPRRLLLLSAVGLAAGLGLAFLLVLAGERQPAAMPLAGPQAEAFKAEGRQSPAAAPAPEAANLKVALDAGRCPSCFILTVSMPQAGKAKLWAQVKEQTEQVFSGELAAGQHRFEWRAKAQGHLAVVLESGQTRQERWVWVERR